MGSKSRTIVISPDSQTSRPDTIDIGTDLHLQLTYDNHGNITSFYFYGNSKIFPSDVDLIKIVTEINAIWNPKHSTLTLFSQGHLVTNYGNLTAIGVPLFLVMYTVPTNKTLFLMQYDLDLDIGVGAAPPPQIAQLQFYDPFGNPFNIATLQSSLNTTEKHTQGTFSFLALPTGSYIQLNCQTNNVTANASFIGVLI